MKQCIECERHLFGPDAECPFCGAAQPTSGASRGAAASVTLAIGLSLCSCGPQITQDPTDGGTEESDTGSSTMTATTAMTTVAVTSNATTTVGTDDGTTAASDDVDDSQDDAPCGFYAGCPPDTGPVVFECDIFAQDCPPGDKCMPWANDGSNEWNATRCSPVADNPDGLGEPCTVEGSGTSGLDSCDLGLMCWDVDPATNEGVCIAFCQGDETNPVCADEQVCSITNDGALVLCLDACNPLVQDCDAGSGCYSPYGFEQWPFVCWPTEDPGTYPVPCDFLADCDPGSFCALGELVPGCPGGSCCTEYCDVTMPGTCAGAGDGAICRTWWENAMPPPGYEDLGGCLLP